MSQTVFLYPKSVGKHSSHPEQPHHEQGPLGGLPFEEHLAERGAPQLDEPAEGDEREEEVVHEGGHPPQHNGGDAEGLSCMMFEIGPLLTSTDRRRRTRFQ